MFKYNRELHAIGTWNYDRLHLCPTRTSGARNVLRHHIPPNLMLFDWFIQLRMLRYQLLGLHQQLRMIKRPDGDLWAMTATWSLVLLVARLIAVTSRGVGGDLRVAAVTGSLFRWGNSDSKGSMMGGISLAYHVKLYRIYYILMTTDLHCCLCNDVRLQCDDINRGVWRRTT